MKSRTEKGIGGMSTCNQRRWLTAQALYLRTKYQRIKYEKVSPDNWIPRACSLTGYSFKFAVCNLSDKDG
jgi:hypothetical protein